LRVEKKVGVGVVTGFIQLPVVSGVLWNMGYGLSGRNVG